MLKTCSIVPNNVLRNLSSLVGMPTCSPSLSTHSCLPTYPNIVQSVNILNCLKNLASIRGSKNKIATLDYDLLVHKKVHYLPPDFDGDIVFKFPSVCNPSLPYISGNLQGMDKRYNGHAWCRTMTSNIHNQDDLKFRKAFCARHLICNNDECEFLKQFAKCNEKEWSSGTGDASM